MNVVSRGEVEPHHSFRPSPSIGLCRGCPEQSLCSWVEFRSCAEHLMRTPPQQCQPNTGEYLSATMSGMTPTYSILFPFFLFSGVWLVMPESISIFLLVLHSILLSNQPPTNPWKATSVQVTEWTDNHPDPVTENITVHDYLLLSPEAICTRFLWANMTSFWGKSHYWRPLTNRKSAYSTLLVHQSHMDKMIDSVPWNHPGLTSFQSHGSTKSMNKEKTNWTW